MNDRAMRRYAAHAGLCSVVVLAVTLWRYPASAYYPACPIYSLLHVRCPGCGATRALAALLHGHLLEAMRWNAVFVTALPFLLGYSGFVYRRLVSEAEFCWPRVQPIATFAGVAVALSFALARNLLGF